MDRDGFYQQCNKAALATMGRPAEQVLGHHIAEVLGADSEAYRRVSAVLDTGESYTGVIEFGQSRNPERVTYFSVSYVPDTDEAGSLVGVFALGFDVSEATRSQKAAIAELEAEREKTGLLLRQASEAAALGSRLAEVDRQIHSSLDFDTVATLALESGAEVLGADSSALDMIVEGGWEVVYDYGFQPSVRGTRFTDADIPHGRLAVEAGCALAVDDALTDPRVNTELLKSYGLKSVIVAPLFMRGQPTGVLFYNYHARSHSFTAAEIDFVTKLAASLSLAMDNARSNAAVRLAEERLLLATATPQLVLSETDMDLRYIWIRNQHPDFDPSSVQGRRDDELDPSPEAAKLLSIKRQVLESGAPVHTEWSIQLSDGRHYYDLYFNPRRDSAGALVGLTSAAIDITPQKRAEERAERELAKTASLLAALQEKDRAIRQAYSDVIDAVTGGRLIVIGRDELDREFPQEGQSWHEIRLPSDLAGARTRVRELLEGIPEADDLVLAFAEGATNMVKHAGGGFYLVLRSDRLARLVLKDEGGGIRFRDLPKATLVSGYSTQQTLGMGFTLMLELMDRLLLCTDETGTVLILEKDTSGQTTPRAAGSRGN